MTSRFTTGVIAMFGTLFLLMAGVAVAGAHRENEAIRPIPRTVEVDPGRVELGRILFFDTRLSGDGTVSCASCHKMQYGGTDERVPSLGVGGAPGEVKAPTVFNSRFNVAQFWDGRAADLYEQLDGPVTNPVEMNSSWEDIVARLKGDDNLVGKFTAIYPDGITAENLKDALTAFEASLITPDSPFDRWLRGDDNALSAEQLAGYRLFESYGCVACHQGVNVGGNLYQRMGVMYDYFEERGTPLTRADLGRFNVTGDEEDKHYFKVPSLRMVALEKHFFHDGSVDELDRAIQLMGRYQLGRDIPAEDREKIAAFLRSLLGNHPLLQAP